MADGGPSIAEVIGEIRRQLEQAKVDGERSSLRFDVGSAELTFTVGVDNRLSQGVDQAQVILDHRGGWRPAAPARPAIPGPADEDPAAYGAGQLISGR
jgi:hypothetical protein